MIDDFLFKYGIFWMKKRLTAAMSHYIMNFRVTAAWHTHIITSCGCGSDRKPWKYLTAHQRETGGHKCLEHINQRKDIAQKSMDSANACPQGTAEKSLLAGAQKAGRNSLLEVYVITKKEP